MTSTDMADLAAWDLAQQQPSDLTGLLASDLAGPGSRLAGLPAPGLVAAIAAGWRRRRFHRARLAHTLWDLRERYGPAAPAIAQSSARRAAGLERRFWIKVAARLRSRSGGSAER
jgi:hypothetical protein